MPPREPLPLLALLADQPLYRIEECGQHEISMRHPLAHEELPLAPDHVQLRRNLPKARLQGRPLLLPHRTPERRQRVKRDT